MIFFRRLHHWLLGETHWAGWTPYLWLPYIGFLFIDWLQRPVSALEKAATLTAIGVFLVLYFGAYRASLKPARLRYIVGIEALGLMLLPINTGSGVFFIYSGAFCGFLGSMRQGFITLAVVLLVPVAESALFRLEFWYWGPYLLFGLIIGLSNIYFGEMSRKTRALKQSQEEIRRLAATAERERIARDLHDLLGHTLTLITVKAELAARLAERDVAAAAREVRELESISRDALRQVREAVGGYRSGGLLSELASARIALQAANVELQVDMAQQEYPQTHENLLSMVLREAVTNVVRHARATRCRVQASRDGDVVILSIQDDGRGGARLREGNGICGMRERLAALDGDLEIDSDAEGTRLTARLPLPEAEPALMVGRLIAAREGRV